MARPKKLTNLNELIMPILKDQIDQLKHETWLNEMTHTALVLRMDKLLLLEQNLNKNTGIVSVVYRKDKIIFQIENEPCFEIDFTLKHSVNEMQNLLSKISVRQPDK